MRRRILLAAMMMCVLSASLSCRKSTTTDPESEWNALSAPNEILFSQPASTSGSAFSITAAETYDAILSHDGLERLIDIVDAELLASYLADITDEETAAMMQKMTDNAQLDPIYRTSNALLANIISIYKQYAGAIPLTAGIDPVELAVARERYTAASTDSGPAPDASDIAAAMAQLRYDYGFTIHDRLLAVQYHARYALSAAADGADPSALASLSGTPEQPDTGFTLTPDDFLTRSLAHNLIPCLLRAIERKVLLDPVHFTPLFGEETDLQENDRPAMRALRDQTAAIQAAYEAGAGANGDTLRLFPYDNYDEYLFDLYGVRNADDLLEALVIAKVKDAMTAMLVMDELDTLKDRVDDRQNLSFDLVADMLVFDIDVNGNGLFDDDYESYRSMHGQWFGLIEQETALKSAVDAWFLAHPDADIRALFTAYRAADAADPVFGPFVAYGFRAAIVPLRSYDAPDSGRVANFGPNGLETQFAYATLSQIRTVYRTLIAEAAPSVARTPCFSMADGIAVIEAADAAAIDFPGFRFAESDPAHPVYPIGSSNTGIGVTEAQLALYLDRYRAMRLYGMTSENEAAVEALIGASIPDLPESVLAACEYYVASALDLIFTHDFYLSGIAAACLGGTIATGTYVASDSLERIGEFDSFVAVYRMLYYRFPMGDEALS